MANKVKQLEDKLSGSAADEHAAENAVDPAVPVTTAPIPYQHPTKSAYPPASRPGADETSFSNNRPSTSSSHHGARPKTPKNADDSDRPSSRRESMALPFVAE